MSKALLVLALIVALLGCNSTKITPDPSKPAVVSLDEAGSGDKAPLRFKPVAGATEQLTIKMTMGMTLAGQTVNVPPMRMGFTFTTREVGADGSFSYDYEVTSVTMDGNEPAAAVAREKLRELQGIKGHAKLSSRGVVLENKMEIPSGASPETKETLQSLQQSFGQIMAPMPEEAVGVGAKWTVTQGVEAKGMVVSQTAHYELVSRDGDKVHLAVKLGQSAEPQQLDMKGTKVELLSLKSDGAGDVHLDLSKLKPDTSNVDMDMKMSAKTMGQTQDVGMRMRIDIE